DLVGQIGETQNRIGAPIATRDAPFIKGDRLAQGPARRLHDATFDLVAHAVRIDDLAAVVGSHEPPQSYLSAFAFDLKLGGDRGVGRQVFIFGKGEAPAISLGWFLGASPTKFFGREFNDGAGA